MQIFLLLIAIATALPATAAVTVCKDQKGNTTYTEYKDCSALGLQNERKIAYIRTQPKHCDSLEGSAKTLNDLADDHGPNGKTRHIASGAVEQLVRRQAKSVEMKYESECVRK